MEAGVLDEARGWFWTLFRNAGFVFASTREILSHSQPTGIRWKNAAERVRRRFVLPQHIQLGQPTSDTLFRHVIEIAEPNRPNPAVPDVVLNNQQALAASPITSETLYDYTTLLTSRLLAAYGPDVAVADLAFGNVARAYLQPHGEGFDLVRYRAFHEPLNPDVGLFVLEALHPTIKPQPRLVAHSVPGRVQQYDLYLYLYRHSTLRIPLATTVRGMPAGVMATGQGRSWLASFTCGFLRFGPAACVTWHRPHPGPQTPLYAQARWLPHDQAIQLAIEQAYDGWLWCVAGLHWLCDYLAHTADSALDYSVGMRRLQHYLAAMYLARHYTAGQAPLETLDVSNTVVHHSNRWLARVHRLAQQPYDVDRLLSQWEADGIVTHALYEEQCDSGDMFTLVEPKKSRVAEMADELGASLADWRVGVCAWRVVLGRLSLGIRAYVTQHQFI
jgi:hypothetical protein